MRLSWFGASITLATFLAGSSLRAAENLLTNPGFEQDIEAWWTAGGGWRTSAAAEGVAAVAHTGGACAIHEVSADDTNTGWRVICQEVTLRPGVRHACGVWIKASGKSTPKCYMEVQFLDQFGKVLWTYQSRFVTADRPFTYVTVNNVVVPAKTVTSLVRGVVHVARRRDGPATFLFDDFDVREASGMEASTPESDKKRTGGRRTMSGIGSMFETNHETQKR